ncbi:MAG: hypothetical protein H0U89_01110, partial [Acidimicrobiia bacterium]|nr:hypothetical protein [Acidimicrobiia bacterium]
MSGTSDLLVEGRCGTCGLDVGSMKPPDAVLAVRSLPRRWGGLLTAVGDDEDLDNVLARRPEDGSWSALEHACGVVLALRL